MILLPKRLFGHRKYITLNTVTISKTHLLENYATLAKYNNAYAIAPVLKSNAYGHGLVEAAKILDSVGAPFFGVDSLYEAYELLKAKIKTRILIMGYVEPENLKVKPLPFSYAVYDELLLETIATYQPHAGIHIKVDTGMNRLGIPVDELDAFLQTLKKYPHVKIEGLMSHLASGDEPNSQLTKLQQENFAKAISIVKNAGFSARWIHLQASAGLLNNVAVDGITMARTGIALYGIDPTGNENSSLKPILRFTTKLVQIKKLAAGDFVGYSGTFQAKQRMTIGILPVGYYDGVDRRLSNNGTVTIDDVVYPIVGNVSMNITTVDISGVSNPSVGQEVVVFSNIASDENSITNTAKRCNTIPYDLLVHITASAKRVIE